MSKIVEFIKKYRIRLTWIGLTLLAGGVGALLAGGFDAYKTVQKPPLSPPDWLFPVVWSILYALMGIGAARIWLSPESALRRRGLNLFVAQLIVNFFWSLIFFNLRAYGFALLWIGLLWVLIVWMILAFHKTDKPAAWLQIPYLLWVTFAAYLNWGVWVLN